MMKVLLIVEDEEIIRDNLHEMLSMYNFDVHTAANGLEGWHKTGALIPDIIISDIKMPVMDGYELLQKIKGTPHLRHIPFICLTANATHEDKTKAMGMGAVDYVTKPFKIDELLATINIHLAKQGLR